MPHLNPQLKAAYAQDLERFGSKVAHLPHDPEAARADLKRRRKQRNSGGPAMAKSENIVMDLPGRTVAARIHRPTAAPRGTVLYAHGGGWVIGDLDTHDRLMRTLAAESGANVVAIAYRKAPEHPFPAALDDMIDGWRWVMREGPKRALDTAVLGIGGDSAGANLALAATQRLRLSGVRAADAHVLFYGVYDCDLDTESYRTFGDGTYGLSRADMVEFWNLYLPDAARRRDPAASPLHGSLDGIARPLLLWAELDALRDDSRKMLQALHGAGHDAVGIEIQSVTHGFLQLGDTVAIARRSLAIAGLHLREAFGAR